MINESSDIRFLKGVGEKRAALFEKLEIRTVGDLLRHYPRDYRDWSKTVSITQAVIGETCCIKAIAGKTSSGVLIRKGLTIFKTSAADEDAVLSITIYNNKYAAKSLVEGEEYYFYGKVSGNLLKKEMNSPEILKVSEENNIIHPVYSQTQGINSKYIEKLISCVIHNNPQICVEVIPDKIRKELSLIEINEAIREIHFPSNEQALSKAKKRLIFEELFILQLGLMSLRGNAKQASKIPIKKDFSAQFYSTLPFSPTNAQLRAVKDCVLNMKNGLVMNRLLQGDVGSGKTLVAAAVIYNTVKNGYQAAFMAPTEILAQQHYISLNKLFENSDINIALLTGSTPAKKKREIKADLVNGQIDLIIGTHAIIQSDVKFKNVGFVITDEQHRFGVKQRSALTDKAVTPHTLVMSATPIPRTLALIIYGDLDISVLDELPPGRQPIETYAIDSSKRERAYNYVKKHLNIGRQAYIVCPLVEENDDETLAAAQSFAKTLSEESFKDYSIGLLYGKMKPKDKQEVMADFVNGKIQLLVATTVIEVGVDVPNAVIMIIENSERFGLSQLHQLRGRIGRGEHKSTCILISDAKGETAKSRIKIMAKTSDGFKIADEDLKIRGPGDFFGHKQHGLPELKIAMLTDSLTLEQANRFAREVIDDDALLLKEENAKLKTAVKSLLKKNEVMN